MAIRERGGFLGVSRAVGADAPRGEANRAGDTFAPRCNGADSGSDVGHRVRYRHRTNAAVGGKISQVLEPGGYAPGRGNASSAVRHSIGSTKERSSSSIRSSSGQVSISPDNQGEMGSHSVPDRGGRSSFLGTLVEGIVDRLIYGPGVLFKVITKPIVFLLSILWYFGQAVTTGDIFPIRSQRKIFDQGKEIGYLDGGKPRTIGRVLALVVLALVNAGWELGVFSVWVGLTLGAFVGVQLGLLDNPAGDNWMWAVNTAAGASGIALLVVVARAIYQRKIEGLNTLIPKMFGLQKEKPEQEQPQPYVRRDDDIMVNRIENTLSDWAEKIEDSIQARLNNKTGGD